MVERYLHILFQPEGCLFFYKGCFFFQLTYTTINVLLLKCESFFKDLFVKIVFIVEDTSDAWGLKSCSSRGNGMLCLQ